ncbi:MAG: transposase, partial [Rhodanobacter sp.]
IIQGLAQILLEPEPVPAGDQPRRADGDKDNPRFILTNLERKGEELYERVHCARGEMENRIKEQQQDLFADRLSSAGFAANQLRICLFAVAYQFVERLRAYARKGTELGQATADRIRLKLFKLAERVEVSVRRMRVLLSEANPSRALFARVWARLRALPG